MGLFKYFGASLSGNTKKTQNFFFLSFFQKYHVQLSLEHEQLKIIVLVFGEPLLE
jgi:hypothetical protein